MSRAGGTPQVTSSADSHKDALEVQRFYDPSANLVGMLVYMNIPNHQGLDCIAIHDAMQLEYDESNRVISMTFTPPVEGLSPLSFGDWRTKCRSLLDSAPADEQGQLETFFNVHSLCEAASGPKMSDHPFGSGAHSFLALKCLLPEHRTVC